MKVFCGMEMSGSIAIRSGVCGGSYLSVFELSVEKKPMMVFYRAFVCVCIYAALSLH